jgi:hypothetical protein
MGMDEDGTTGVQTLAELWLAEKIGSMEEIGRKRKKRHVCRLVGEKPVICSVAQLLRNYMGAYGLWMMSAKKISRGFYD